MEVLVEEGQIREGFIWKVVKNNIGKRCVLGTITVSIGLA